MTRWFHEAENVRDAAAAVREIARLVELLARVSEAAPAPADAPKIGEGFTWPDGSVQPVVPLESDAELAEHDGIITPHRLALVAADEAPATLPDGTPRRA